MAKNKNRTIAKTIVHNRTKPKNLRQKPKPHYSENRTNQIALNRGLAVGMQ